MKFRHTQITESAAKHWTPGLVKNVAVCGLKSKNGYRYREAALKKILPQYDNQEIYLDHAGKQTTNRTVSEHFATIRKPFWDESAKIVRAGEFSYRQEHPFAKQFEEQLKRDEKWFRLSHVADGTIEDVLGQREVTEVTKIHGVDLVTNAATTASLFESTLVEEDQPMAGGDQMTGSTSEHPNTDAAVLEGAAADCAAILADTSLDKQGKLDKISALLDKLEGIQGAAAEANDAAPASEQVKALEAQVAKLVEQVATLTKPPKKYTGQREQTQQRQETTPLVEAVPLNDPQAMKEFWRSAY